MKDATENTGLSRVIHKVGNIGIIANFVHLQFASLFFVNVELDVGG